MICPVGTADNCPEIDFWGLGTNVLRTSPVGRNEKRSHHVPGMHRSRFSTFPMGLVRSERSILQCFIRRRAIDWWQRNVQQPKINRQLPSMMNEMVEGRRTDDDQAGHLEDHLRTVFITPG